MRRYHCFFLQDAVFFFFASLWASQKKPSWFSSLLLPFCSMLYVFSPSGNNLFANSTQCNQLNNIEKLYCLSTYDYKYFASVVKENRRRNIDLRRRPSRLFTLKLNPVTHGIMKELLETKHIILVCIFIVLYCL